MTRIGFAVGIAALLFSGAAAAQTGGGLQKGERWGGQGGDLSRAEAIAKADARFQRMDLDNDGRVTREEMQQARQRMRAQGQQRMQERLAQMTPEQRAAIEQRRAERGGERAQRRGNRAGGEARGQRGERGAGMFGAQGFVTLAQFRERALQRFDRMDLDNDGIVTAAERQQARQRMRGQHRRTAR